ncbi:hypothetical protein CY35_13G070300 [Sphagnum magellanicum]|nr:hypothetical protein CY35_13G070300 [Sphagnum magellanicum]
MGSLRRENLLLGKIGVIVGVFIVLVSFAGTEVMGKDTPEQHKVHAKEAVEQEFKGWVERMGARYDAKHAADAGDSLASTQTYTFANQLRTVTTKTIVVDQKGKGNYKTVQAAVNSIKQGNKQRVVIQINPGVYREKIKIPSTKPYITFYGQAGAAKTILVYGDTAAKAGSTSLSASTTVMSDGFIARGISFRNSAPAPVGGAVGRQAVALLIQGDKAAFYTCSFYGAQDTLYDKSGRHYFKNCYIQGSIDFIFGDGQSYYEKCHLNSIANPGSGSLTAQKRSSKGEDTGFSFVGCVVTGSGPIYLGRAWGPYSRVVFIRTYIEDLIIPAGWYDWGLSSRRKTVYYGQYKCSGPGANTKGRVNWSLELTDAQARPFKTISFIDGASWLSSL